MKMFCSLFFGGGGRGGWVGGQVCVRWVGLQVIFGSMDAIIIAQWAQCNPHYKI
jgi:hypothetical protein